MNIPILTYIVGVGMFFIEKIISCIFPESIKYEKERWSLTIEK